MCTTTDHFNRESNSDNVNAFFFFVIFCSFTDNTRSSHALSQPYSYSMVNFMDFTAKQRGDNRGGKQVLSPNNDTLLYMEAVVYSS